MHRGGHAPAMLAEEKAQGSLPWWRLELPSKVCWQLHIYVASYITVDVFNIIVEYT